MVINESPTNASVWSAIPSPVGRVTESLRADESRIVTNWALRVANLPAFRAIPDLSLTGLQEGIPSLLTALLAALAIGDSTLDAEPLAQVADEAAKHGRVRAVKGFPIGVVVRECHHLRAEVWAAILRIVAEDPAGESALAEMRSRVDGTFDTIAVAAAEGWSSVHSGSAPS